MNKFRTGLFKLSSKKVLLVLLLLKVMFVLYWFGVRISATCNLQPLYNSIDDNSVLQFLPRLTTYENKNILIWNSPERIETAVFGLGHEPFVQHGCEISECTIYNNASSLPLEQYDAILINMQELWSTQLPSFARKKHQRFVFLTQESPMTMLIDITSMNDFFNWTMSYRLNSDVRLLYGRIEPGPTAPKTPEETAKLIERTRLPSSKNYAANKTRPVVWMASHCDTYSFRESYVRLLGKFIPVDVYGLCGNLTCQRDEWNWISDPICYDILEAKYKFYLSFENSICDDYVTEKFFDIMGHDMIPIVFGGANYSSIAPPHSYISALEFSSPEKLAQHIKLLNDNDTMYNEYFWWKDHYRVESGVEQMARHGFCDLCKKLHQDEGVVKYYPELVSEWHPNKRCRTFEFWKTVP